MKEPILVVAKRAVIADQRGLESYDKSHSYGETAADAVNECRERFAEVSPTWEKFVEDYLPFGLKWANELVRLSKLSTDDRKLAMDKRAEQQRQYRIASGKTAPRVVVEIDEGDKPQVGEGEKTRIFSPKSGREKPPTRYEKRDGKKRTEKIAGGKQPDKPPLAPIETRRLLNDLKAKLSTLSMSQLRQVEAWLHEEFFAPDRASRSAA